MFDDKLKELRWKNEVLRRSKRRMKLPEMLVRLQNQFRGLLSSITSQVQGLTDMVGKLHEVEQAAKVVRRYIQLANEARLLGLHTPEHLSLPQDILNA